MSEPVYFLKLEMKNVRCFGEAAVLDLSDGKGNWKQWTVLVGDNGAGKTTILKAIAPLQHIELPLDEYGTRYGSDYSLFRENFNNENAPELPAIFSDPTYLEGKYKPVFVHATLSNGFKATTSVIGSGPVSKDASLSNFLIYGYGANRLISKGSLTVNKSENSSTLFDEEAKLINAEEWLLQLDYTASKESAVKAFAINKRNQVQQLLVDLLPDIEAVEFTVPTKENLRSSVQFKSTLSGWISIHQLSLGYKTMVAWMVDLAARLFERYPDSDNPLAEPAIVLVDEIDLHLHPKWQRKLFDYLTERFPKTQFVVTAHSPLVVQAAPPDANLVLLRKEGDLVVIDNEIESVHNWRLDQILSCFYDINSSRGPETEKWMTERKLLLQKKDLSGEEQERLEELNEKTFQLPTADNPADIKAMDIIRKAAAYLQSQKA